jgi:hypothetical protein
MIRRFILAAIAAVLGFFPATPAWPVVEAGALLLQYPIHVRTVSTGETGVADASDPSTIYYNPANVVAPGRAYVTTSRMDWPDDWFAGDIWMGRANAGYSWQARGGALRWGADLTLGKLDYGESIVTNPAGDVLATVHPFEKVASLAVGVGCTAGERFDLSFGVAGKRWWANYGAADVTQDNLTAEPTAYAFDTGITAVMRTTVTGWSVNPALGVAVVDMGPDFEVVAGESKDPLPRRFNFGAGVHIASPNHRLGKAEVPLVALSCNVDGMSPRYGDFEWGMGSELAIAQILFLRTGTHVTHQDAKTDPVRSGWGAGVGVPVGPIRARFDYANGTYWNNDGFVFKKHYMGATVAWVF